MKGVNDVETFVPAKSNPLTAQKLADQLHLGQIEASLVNSILPGYRPKDIPVYKKIVLGFTIRTIICADEPADQQRVKRFDS